MATRQARNQRALELSMDDFHRGFFGYTEVASVFDADKAFRLFDNLDPSEADKETLMRHATIGFVTAARHFREDPARITFYRNLVTRIKLRDGKLDDLSITEWRAVILSLVREHEEGSIAFHKKERPVYLDEIDCLRVETTMRQLNPGNTGVDAIMAEFNRLQPRTKKRLRAGMLQAAADEKLPYFFSEMALRLRRCIEIN